jgi:hypothetical protein
VALGDAKATFTFPDGKTQDVELKKDAGLYTPAFTHAPANTGTTPIDETTAGPDFHEAPGTTHEYDQVVIALGASDMSLAVDGNPAVTKWKRGDVQFIGRGVKHESREHERQADRVRDTLAGSLRGR